MRAVAFGVVAIALVGLSGAARAADDNKTLIVGTWEIVYSDAKEIQAGTKLEFTADGKVKVTPKPKDKDKGKETTVDLGGYKVDQQWFTLTGKDGTKNEKGRIALLNKSSLVINDEIEDNLMVLKKVAKKP